MPTKSQVVNFITKLLVALGFAGLLAFLSIFPSVGYFGSAHVDRGAGGRPVVEYHQVPDSLIVYGIVNYNYNMTYNPLLFPLAWLHGSGSASGFSSMMVLPTSMPMAGPFTYANWPLAREMDEDAVTRMVYREIALNFLVLLVIALAIEFAEIRSLFVCLLVGVIGFVPGGLVGTIIGVILGAFIVVFVTVRFKKESRLAQILNSLRKDKART